MQPGLTCRKAEIRRVEVVIAAHHCLFLFVSTTQLYLKMLFPYCSALCVFSSFKDTNRYRNRVIIVSPRYVSKRRALCEEEKTKARRKRARLHRKSSQKKKSLHKIIMSATTAGERERRFSFYSYFTEYSYIHFKYFDHITQ